MTQVLLDYWHAVKPYWWAILVGVIMPFIDLIKWHGVGKEFTIPRWLKWSFSVAALFLAQFLAYRDSIENLRKVETEKSTAISERDQSRNTHSADQATITVLQQQLSGKDRPIILQVPQKSGDRMASVAWGTPSVSTEPWSFNAGYADLGPFDASNFDSRIQEDVIPIDDAIDPKHQTALRNKFITETKRSIAKSDMRTNLGVGRDKYGTLVVRDKNEVDLIIHGKKVIEIRGYAEWDDSSGKHVTENCNWLQPPIISTALSQPQAIVWHDCK